MAPVTPAPPAAAPAVLQPAEWTRHAACWVAWPSDPALWPAGLPDVQRSMTALCRAIAQAPGEPQGDRLEVLVQDDAAQQDAARALAGLPARFHQIPFGDIWLRDTAPVFIHDTRGALAGACFRFNGWGGRFVYPHDAQVATRIAQRAGVPTLRSDWVLEGGALESDGAGSCITTRACVLNDNRNPGRGASELERELRRTVGATRVIWLERGLRNDHTDGHVDNLARFVAPGVVACARPAPGDPNGEVLGEVEAVLRQAGLAVRTLPSPGLVEDGRGEPLPASYLNFYIANHSVAVPTFGVAQDATALRALQALFPGRAVVGVPARPLLAEGGTLHCVTQQQPESVARADATP